MIHAGDCFAEAETNLPLPLKHLPSGLMAVGEVAAGHGEDMSWEMGATVATDRLG